MRRLMVVLLASLAVGASALIVATPASAAENTVAGQVGVLGGCDWTGCGTAVNATGRGFHVTLLWGAPWADDIIRWVGPWSALGGNGVDVDGIYVGSGCVMSGVINGRVPGYNYPFVWTSGWHKIWTNETAFVNYNQC